MGKKNFQFVFRHFKNIIFSSVVIVIFCCPSVRADFDPVLAARLQNVVDSVRSYWNYKGVSVSVNIPSKGTWTGTSGVSHGTVGITPGMKFGIASNTKTFIAVLMLKLQEMNVLNLDDSLYKWIPNFQYVDSTITIRQLLNHTSGVYNYTTYPGFGNAMSSDTGRFWTPEELLMTFMNQPYFNPGAGFQYSNTNYILAGMVIKAATGNTVSHNLRQLILNPSNLMDTYFPLEESVPDIAHGWHFGVEIKYPRTSSISSAFTSGAMYSTAENMVRFYKELFDVQIINQSSLNQMLTFPQQPIGIYGLGISNGLFGGRTKLFHTGGIAGYISFAGIDTTAKFIISVLINQTPSDFFNFIPPLDNAILDHLSTNISNSGISFPEKFSLSQNYPNPFNPSTKINWQSPVSSHQTIKVYDVLGNEVATLVDEYKPAGIYEIEFNASPLSSGVYFYQLQIGNPSSGTGQSFVHTRKMLLIR